MKNRLMKLWNEYRGFTLFVVLMVIFRSVLADWNSVPTGSMKPTILEGDRILVNKLAYDLRIPLTPVSIFRFGDPARGEIVGDANTVVLSVDYDHFFLPRTDRFFRGL